MTEIIAFGSSWQSHYSSGLGGKWTMGFSEHWESCLRVQRKSTDWPAIVINIWGSSGVIKMGACVGTPRHLQSWLSWESDPWGLHLEGSLLSTMVLCRLNMELGQLRCLRATSYEMPLLSIVITSPSIFTWFPLGVFLFRLIHRSFHSHH